MTKYVYLFKEGNASMRNLLGGKGANLAEMTKIGLAGAAGLHHHHRGLHPATMRTARPSARISSSEIYAALAETEKICRQEVRRPGESAPGFRALRRARVHARHDGYHPEPGSERRGRRRACANQTENPRFAYDSYRRFIQMFSDVVMEIAEELLRARSSTRSRRARALSYDTDLNAEDHEGTRRPASRRSTRRRWASSSRRIPKVQLMEAVKAVFRSWDNPRAIYYRRMNDIPSDWGTAVNVQSMVFGNMGNTSGTGVAFTRNPATGEKKLYGEYPDERAGRGRRRRHPHPADRSTDAGQRSCRRFTSSSWTSAQHARKPLPRHAGHGVHHRGRQALHAPDPQRQAHRRRCAEDRLSIWWTRA